MNTTRPTYEPDYIDRKIATVRNHRDADNCWPRWANIFADEILNQRDEIDRLRAALAGLGAQIAALLAEWENTRP